MTRYYTIVPLFRTKLQDKICSGINKTLVQWIYTRTFHLFLEMKRVQFLQVLSE